MLELLWHDELLYIEKDEREAQRALLVFIQITPYIWSGFDHQPSKYNFNWNVNHFRMKEAGKVYELDMDTILHISSM